MELPKQGWLTKTAASLFLIGALSGCASTSDKDKKPHADDFKSQDTAEDFKFPDKIENFCAKPDCSEVIILKSPPSLEAD